MDGFEINNEIHEVLSMLNAEETPELYGYLVSTIDEENGTVEKPYDIASAIVQINQQNAFPVFLFNFVVDLYQIEIEAGNSEAMNDLGALYYDGHGCNQDFTKAVCYYNMAAESGSRLAQENLGYCYYYGRNMPVDYEKAYHYFILGALDGHLISLYKIGDMYQNGFYVKKNEVEAFHIYEHCMETMTEEASKTVAGPVYLRLGNAFLYGKGTEKNAETALICYQKAELFLFDMVKCGDVMYRKSLQVAIAGQAKAREQMVNELPDNLWLDVKKD